jgi:hypothetical protein
MISFPFQKEKERDIRDFEHLSPTRYRKKIDVIDYDRRTISVAS